MTCEPCTYLPDPAADSLPTLSLDIPQLSLLSGFHTPAKSCENEPQTDGSPVCMCTKETFGCSIHPTTPEAWIASMRDSLVRICQSLEIRQDSQKAQEAAFTAKCCESLAWFDRDTYSWKTSQQSFLEDWEPYSQTWPRAGMTVAGVAWKHRESERRIGGIDGGCWQQWQTPVADDAVDRKAGKWNSRGEPKLSEHVMMWPTPTVCGNHNRKGLSPTSGDGLATAVANSAATNSTLNALESTDARTVKAKVWPTPTTNDEKNATIPESQRNRDGMAGALMAEGVPAGGKLNPMWVEWLMAWPLGWTVSKHWVTAKYRCKPQSRGDYLGANDGNQ